MKLYIEPIYSKKQSVLNKVADYNPPEEVKERIKQVKYDYQRAQTVRDQSYEEFNNRDLTEYTNDCMRLFNSFVPEQSTNPDDAWRSNVVKPITRNKCISVAAHITAAVLYPNVVAQNQDAEEDRDAGMVMRDLMDWSWTDSQYEKFHVGAVVAAMYSPAVIVEERYARVKRIQKEIQPNGSYIEKMIEDEVYSGFQNEVIPVEDIFIGNFYEADIQKQPFLIKRQIIDYSEAQVKYGHEEYFQYVTPGVRYFYSNERDLFYEDSDDAMEDSQVEEVIYYNRLSDLELVFVNGVLIGDDPDRPMQRYDKRYPFVKFGFEPFNSRCFYYKTLVDKMAPEQGIIDVVYSMAIDASMLQTMPPAVLFGDEQVNSSINIPGKVTPFNAETKIEQLKSGANMNPALTMVQNIEQSLSDSGGSGLLGGSTPQGGQTAFEIATMQQNAMRVLGLFGKMVKFFVEEFGDLRLNSIIQYMLVADAVDTMSTNSRLRFQEVLVADRTVDGKKMNRKIRFTQDIPTEEGEILERAFALLEEEEKKDMAIAEANPKLMRMMKYRTKVEADMLFSQSETVRKALNLEAYDRAIGNPIIGKDPNALREVTRRFLLENYVPGEEDKFLPEEVTAEQQMAQQAGAQQPPGTGLTESIMQQAGAQQPATV